MGWFSTKKAPRDTGPKQCGNGYQYLLGQRVLVHNEIGTIVPSESGGYPFDVWVFLPSKGYASCYAFSSIKPLPNGQL